MVWNIVDRLKGSELAEGSVLSKELCANIVAEFEKYPTKQAVLLTALHWVQKELGQLSTLVRIKLRGRLWRLQRRSQKHIALECLQCFGAICATVHSKKMVQIITHLQTLQDKQTTWA